VSWTNAAIAVSRDSVTVYLTGTVEAGGSLGTAGLIFGHNAATGGPPTLDARGGNRDLRGIAVSPDGGTLAVTGGSAEPASTPSNYFTRGFNTADFEGGGLINTYNGPGNGADDAYAIAFSPDSSTIYVTGQSTGTGTGLDFATEAIQGLS
jgi:hypothetical protein